MYPPSHIVWSLLIVRKSMCKACVYLTHEITFVTKNWTHPLRFHGSASIDCLPLNLSFAILFQCLKEEISQYFMVEVGLLKAKQKLLSLKKYTKLRKANYFVRFHKTFYSFIC